MDDLELGRLSTEDENMSVVVYPRTEDGQAEYVTIDMMEGRELEDDGDEQDEDEEDEVDERELERIKDEDEDSVEDSQPNEGPKHNRWYFFAQPNGSGTPQRRYDTLSVLLNYDQLYRVVVDDLHGVDIITAITSWHV